MKSRRRILIIVLALSFVFSCYLFAKAEPCNTMKEVKKVPAKEKSINNREAKIISSSARAITNKTIEVTLNNISKNRINYVYGVVKFYDVENNIEEYNIEFNFLWPNINQSKKISSRSKYKKAVIELYTQQEGVVFSSPIITIMPN